MGAQALLAQKTESVPAWCHFVPAEFQSVACRGSNASGCTCQDFCKDTPSSSWPNNPECCSCNAEEASRATPSSSAKVAAALAQKTESMPAWCHFVPAEFQRVACHGSNAS